MGKAGRNHFSGGQPHTAEMGKAQSLVGLSSRIGNRRCAVAAWVSQGGGGLTGAMHSGAVGTVKAQETSC